MKLKNTLAAVSLAMAVSGASASDIYLGTLPVANDTDMDNLTVGTFTVTETSKIDGLLYYIPTAVVPGLNISIPFSSATFAAASLFSGGFENIMLKAVLLSRSRTLLLAPTNSRLTVILGMRVH